MNTSIQGYIDNRISGLVRLQEDDALACVLSSIENVLCHCISNGGRIYTVGNGGSCAQAQHFAAELIGRFGSSHRRALPAISLTSDSAVISALSNDFGYELCFSRQIEALLTPDDVLIAFTTSGGSRNIIEAIQCAKNKGSITIVFSGGQDSFLKDESDYYIATPANDTALIQECHLMLSHYLCDGISQHFSRAGDSFWSRIVDCIPAGIEFLILDRDGVINEKLPNRYVISPKDFAFTAGFLENVKYLSARFRRVFVVTNQKGVGLGLMSMDDLHEIHAYMQEEISRHGGRIDNIYYSTKTDNLSEDRKPNVGMAKHLKADYPEVDFNKTLVIGDSASDQLFAKNIGALFIQYVKE